MSFDFYKWFVILSVCFLSACSPPLKTGPVNAVAENIIVAFQENDVEKIMSYYGEKFYVSRSPETWKDELNALFKENGKVKNITIRNKMADTRFSGKFYIYQFDSVHENDKRIKHTLTIIRPVTSPEEIVVVGHQVKSK